MNYITLTTAKKDSNCGAHAIGHMIVLLWNRLTKDTQNKIIAVVSDYYDMKVTNHLEFIQSIKQLSGYDIQRFMSYPIVALIQKMNQKNLLEHQVEYFKNSIKTIIYKAQSQDGSGFQTKFEQCIDAITQPAELLSKNLETFEQSLSQLNDINLLRLMLAKFTSTLGGFDDQYLDSSEDYQQPNSFFEGQQLACIISELMINFELYSFNESGQHELIAQNHEYTQSPIFQLISDNSHWEPIFFGVDVSQYKQINARFSQDNLLHDKHCESETKKIFKDLLAQSFSQNSLIKYRSICSCLQLNHLSGGKGTFFKPILSSMTSSSDVITPSNTRENLSSEASDNTTLSPTSTRSSAISSANHSPLLEDSCPWDQLYLDYVKLDDNKKTDLLIDAMGSIDEIMHKDSSDQYIKRPNVRRARLKINELIPFLPHLKKLLDHDDRIKKYQIISTLYHVQAAVNGKSIIMSLGTGTGKTMIMGMVSTLLAQQGKTIVLVERTCRLQAEHQSRKEYPFQHEDNANIAIIDRFDQKSQLLTNGGILWTTLHHFKKYFFHNDHDNNTQTNFAELFGNIDAIIFDEAHDVITEIQANIAYHDIQQDKRLSHRHLSQWINFNAFCAKEGISIGAYTATPGAVTKQLRVCGAAFGTNFQDLMKVQSQNDRYPALIQEGGMVTYYMDTTKSLKACVFDDAFDTQTLNELCYGSISFKEGQKNIKSLYEYLSLVYLICVADKSIISQKDDNRSIISLILRKMRFIHSIRLMLNVIHDFSQNPDQYIDKKNDQLRTVFYLKDFNDISSKGNGSALRSIIHKIKTKYLNQEHAWKSLEAFKQYIADLKIQISDDTWRFIEKHNLLFGQDTDCLKHIHQILPTVSPWNTDKVNLKVWMKQWVEAVHQNSSLSDVHFSMDVDAKYYGDEKHKMLIISKSSSVGADITAKGKQVRNIFLSVPSSNLEFMQVIGRFSRMNTLGDELATMTFAMTRKEDWFTLYSLHKLKKEVGRKLGHRMDGETVPAIIDQLNDVSKCIKVNDSKHYLRFYTKTISFKSTYLADDRLKAIMNGHYKFLEGKLAGTELLLFLSSLQVLLNQQSFDWLKASLGTLLSVSQSSSINVLDYYHFDNKNVTLDTKSLKLTASESWKNRASIFIDAVLKCANIKDEEISKVMSVDSFVVEFQHHQQFFKIRDALIHEMTQNQGGLLNILSGIDEEYAEYMRSNLLKFLADFDKRFNLPKKKHSLTKQNESSLKVLSKPKKRKKSPHTGLVQLKHPLTAKKAKLSHHSKDKSSENEMDNKDIVFFQERSDAEIAQDAEKIHQSLMSKHAQTLAQLGHDLRSRRDNIIHEFTTKYHRAKSVSGKIKIENEAIIKHRNNLIKFKNNILALYEQLPNHSDEYCWVYPHHKQVGSNGERKIVNIVSIYMEIIEYSRYMLPEIEALQADILAQLQQTIGIKREHLTTLTKNQIKALQRMNSDLYLFDADEIYQCSLLYSAISFNNYPVIAFFIESLNKNNALDGNLMAPVLPKEPSFVSTMLKQKNGDGEDVLQLVFQLIGDYLCALSNDNYQLSSHKAYLLRQCVILEMLMQTDCFKGSTKLAVLTSNEAHYLARVMTEKMNLLKALDKETAEASKIKFLELFIAEYYDTNPSVLLDCCKTITWTNQNNQQPMSIGTNLSSDFNAFKQSWLLTQLKRIMEKDDLNHIDRDRLYHLLMEIDLPDEQIFVSFIKDFQSKKNHPVDQEKASPALYHQEKLSINSHDNRLSVYKNQLMQVINQLQRKDKMLNQTVDSMNEKITILMGLTQEVKLLKKDFVHVAAFFTRTNQTENVDQLQVSREQFDQINVIADLCQATPHDRLILLFQHLSVGDEILKSWMEKQQTLSMIDCKKISNIRVFKLFIDILCSGNHSPESLKEITASMSMDQKKSLDKKHINFLMHNQKNCHIYDFEINTLFDRQTFNPQLLPEQFRVYLAPPKTYNGLIFSYSILKDDILTTDKNLLNFIEYLNSINLKPKDVPYYFSSAPIFSIYYCLFVWLPSRQYQSEAGQFFLENYDAIIESDTLASEYKIKIYSLFIDYFLYGMVYHVELSKILSKTLEKNFAKIIKECMPINQAQFLWKLVKLDSINQWIESRSYDESSKTLVSAKFTQLTDLLEHAKLAKKAHILKIVKFYELEQSLILMSTENVKSTFGHIIENYYEYKEMHQDLKKTVNFFIDDHVKQLKTVIDDNDLTAFSGSLRSKIILAQMLIVLDINGDGYRQARLFIDSIKNECSDLREESFMITCLDVKLHDPLIDKNISDIEYQYPDTMRILRLVDVNECLLGDFEFDAALENMDFSSFNF